MKIRNLFSFIVILIALTQNACISFTTLQTAETNDPGEFSVNGGGMIDIEGPEIIPEIGFRYGLTDRTDFGLKVNFGRVIFADAKIELIQSPYLLSFDMGASYYSLGSESSDFSNEVIAYYPTLLLGGNKGYLGLKSVYLITKGTSNILIKGVDYEGEGWLKPWLVVGTSFGKNIRIYPELSIIFTDDDIGLLPAIGFDVKFNSNKGN